jgi:phosphatidylglycerol---prolipoprotein diacylglyceryl transferase
METILGVIKWHAYPRVGGISPHGVGIAVGYLVAGSLMVRHAARRGISADDVWNMLMRAVIGVIIGARLFYVMGHPGEFFGAGQNFIDIFKIWQGGIVFYGGVFGGIAVASPYMRKHGLSFKAVMDSAAPAFPLGLIFGRIGDIIVGDHLGGASTLPFAFRFSPYDSRLALLDPSRYVAHPTASPACFDLGCHQTALYDLWSVIILLPVVLWLARKPRPPGFLIAFTATWYGGARLFTDIARDSQKYLGLHGTQWASFALILIGTWYMLRLKRGWVPEEPAVVGMPESDAPDATDVAEAADVAEATPAEAADVAKAAPAEAAAPAEEPVSGPRETGPAPPAEDRPVKSEASPAPEDTTQD